MVSFTEQKMEKIVSNLVAARSHFGDATGLNTIFAFSGSVPRLLGELAFFLKAQPGGNSSSSKQS